ncbi:MAG: FAD-dependent oxidoreductase [Deltaproteobacteria bacterium]|nr:FAD-dependent oxidoreductase [Deltaproteobacteria bacterium]
MQEFDVAVIGAGPAGISAAIESAALGVSVALIDDSPLPGGKVFAYPVNYLEGSERKIRNRLFRGMGHFKDRIFIFSETEVWNIQGEYTLGLCRKEISGAKPLEIRAKKIIISIGALERSLPFSGWTLPGVFSLGGMNKLAKKGIVPGKRILIAGSGPLQLVLAYHLLKAGGSIEGIINIASPMQMVGGLPGIFTSASYSLLKSGLRYLINIKVNRIPTYFSHAVSRIDGTDGVESVTIVKLDKCHKPVKGSERQINADCVGYGLGLIPSLDLTRLCGCAHVFDEELGYWRPKLNGNMETTRPGVFVAGDCLTIKGYLAAIEEGKIAAAEACYQLGVHNKNHLGSTFAASSRKLKRYRRFARALEALSRPRPGLLDLITEDTVVCRCEEVTFGQIRSAVTAGARDINDIKRRTRLGMGHCQGRFCGQVINELIMKLTGNMQKREMFTSRIPARPIPFGVLSGQCGGHDDL